MNFAQPAWLWALAAVPVFMGLFLYSERRRKSVLRKLVAARLEARLTGTVSGFKRRARFGLLLSGFVFTLLALARPQYGFSWEETRRKGRDVLIAIDTSKSMLATDLQPNRLTRAKFAAQDLIERLQGDRVGLIAFAGSAFLQAPLTVDYSAVLGALNELDPDIIPQGGTDIAAALKTAETAFGKGESENRAVILFTDGEDLEAAGEKAAAELAGKARIFAVGIGSPEGALIPAPGARASEFIKDSEGQIVKSRLDEDRLRKIAEATGGFYVRLQSGRAEAEQIANLGLEKMSEKEIDAKLSRQPIERYQWPLGAGALLLAGAALLGERKRTGLAGAAQVATAGRVAAALIALSCCAPPSGSAKNQGLADYESGDYQKAQQTFTEQLKRHPRSHALHYDLGSAAYKSGDMDKALASFSQALTTSDPALRTKAQYNLANTLFRRGASQKEQEPKLQEWNNALQHYDAALKSQPDNEDVRYNRDLVRRLIEEAKKKPEQSDPSQSSKDQNKKKQPENKDQKEGSDSSGSPEPGNDSQPNDPQDSPQKPEGNEEKQDPQRDPKEAPEQPPKEGKESQNQNGAQKEDPEKKKNEGKNAGEKPQNNPQGKEDKKKDGSLKSAPQYGGQTQEAQQEQASEARAAEEGKMTPQQAKSLLDSLKNEDERIQWVDPSQRRRPGRLVRDW
jgi:Ca-activated chloride channel family protein